MLQIGTELYHKLLDVLYQQCNPDVAEQIPFKEFCSFAYHEKREYRQGNTLTSVLLYNKTTKQYAINDNVMNDSFLVKDIRSLIKSTVQKHN